MSPRVLFVDHTAKLGGAELSLLAVATAFRDTSQVVLFEEGPFLDRLQKNGVDTTVLPASTTLDGIRRDGSLFDSVRALPGLWRLIWRLARLARDYDVILANSQKSMLVAALAGFLARRPVIWYLRDLMSPAHFGLVQRRVGAIVATAFASHVIANSYATRDALVTSGGPANRISVVHNGIDASPFLAVTPDDVAAVRRELNLPSAGVVGVFSRLAEWKGQHVLIEALRDLPDVTALLVGDALFTEDEHYAARLRSDIERWDLHDRVWMTGFRNDIPVLMQTCDVVLHTSTAPEPFGRVIVEGMLAGRPVIATNKGGPAEIIADGDTGILTPADDPQTLRLALRHMLDNQESATLLARKGHALARSRFSTANMVERVQFLIGKVLQNSPKSTSAGPISSRRPASV